MLILLINSHFWKLFLTAIQIRADYFQKLILHRYFKLLQGLPAKFISIVLICCCCRTLRKRMDVLLCCPVLSPQITGYVVPPVLEVTVNVSVQASPSASAVFAGPWLVNVSKSNLSQQISRKKIQILENKTKQMPGLFFNFFYHCLLVNVVMIL